MDSSHEPIKLTSAELGYLWDTYIADSMSICVFKYFLEHIEDVEVKTVVTQALDLSQQHIEMIAGIFKDEGIQVPEGFTEKDVNLQAKRLFSDIFYLKYLKHMTNGGLATYLWAGFAAHLPRGYTCFFFQMFNLYHGTLQQGYQSVNRKRSIYPSPFHSLSTNN